MKIEEKIAKLNKEYPLIPHTNAGRLFSTVRRMKAEKEMGIPINIRSGFAISVKTRKRANEMDEQEWENFYGALCEELKKDYPGLYDRVFPEIPKGLYQCATCGEYKGKVKEKDLNWDDSFDKENSEKSEKYLTVSCLCAGILCPRCHKNKIHRPISNSYYPETNTIGHWPYFTYMMGCAKCRKK